jgi:hypothetical protein
MPWAGWKASINDLLTTSVVSALGEGLVLAVSVATGWSSSHFGNTLLGGREWWLEEND